MSAAEFNPSEHTVAEVQEYLADVDADEFARVQDAERNAGGRKGILEFTQDADAVEPDADGYTRRIISS